ncbi:MAG TPA: hypothetical protein VF648_10085 [Pyrinomonadaceae bacterium]|jgi:hypothetical protein
MTQILKQIIDSLDSQNWSDLPATFSKINDLLTHINSNRNLLYEELASESFAERVSIAKKSKEVSTHFKWCIHKEERLGYNVWIHEYKDKQSRRLGYAEVLHNHRYWFSSLILSGGFEHYRYNVERIDDFSFKQISVTEVINYSKGDIYTIDSDVVHTLKNIKDSTLTLVIGSKGIKPYSEEFVPSTKKINRHYPFLSRIEKEYPFLKKII